MKNSELIKIAALSGLIAIGGVAASAKTDGKEHNKGHMFETIDANGDGAVTPEEMGAHRAARFASADANGDGFLTAGEMLKMRGGKRAEKMLKKFDKDGNGQLDASELEAAAEHRGGKKAAKMIERMDTDGDGKLALSEMTAKHDPSKMFERLDADKNGSLSAEEFAKARKMHKHGGKRHSD